MTVIEIHHREPPKTYWRCRCDCGREKIVDINYLTQGKTKSCGCLDKENRKRFGRLNYNDLRGKQFGKLTVIKDSMNRTPQGNVIWVCWCECGNIKEIAGSHLLSGDTVSCGCVLSKGEQVIQNILQINNIEYKRQYWFNDCVNPRTGNKLFFDFYLPQYNRCIEFDGEQHYQSRERGYFTSEKVQEIQFRDSVKNQYCKDHGIDLRRIMWYNINNITLEALIGD